MPRLVDYRCPHCGAKLQARQASIGSMVRCKVCGGKINLKGGCGCGSLIGVMAVVAIAIAVFSLIPAGKKPMQPQQPISQVKNPPTTPPEVANSDDQAADDSGAEPDDSNSKPVVEEKTSEAAAEEELRLTELLIENNRVNPARRRLKELIEKYPETEAAVKAKKRLNSILDHN